jgi:hypothetical protein
LGFGASTGALPNQRLRRVKGGEIGIAAGVFAYSGGENNSGATQSIDGP